MKLLYQFPKMAQQKFEQLLVSGFLLATVSLIFINILPKNSPKVRTPDARLICEEMVMPQAELSGEQLAKLLTVPESSKRSKVQPILNQPYCRLPSLNIRAGATTEREAYPLAFDPQTWLIVLYEGDNYVGYGFKRF